MNVNFTEKRKKLLSKQKIQKAPDSTISRGQEKYFKILLTRKSYAKRDDPLNPQYSVQHLYSLE